MNITFNGVIPYNQYQPRKYTTPSFTAQKPDEFVKSGLRVICNYGRSDGVAAKKPMPVCDFINEMRNMSMFGEMQDDLEIYANELAKSPLQEFKIKQLIGYGSSALALETTNNRVLKLSRENHFPMNRPVEDFDARVFDRGKVGKMHYYLAEKCTPCESGMGYADIMSDIIEEKGYRAWDIGTWDDFQVGFNSKCELKLLDPECARYKTPFHKLAQVVKNLFKQN